MHFEISQLILYPLKTIPLHGGNSGWCIHFIISSPYGQDLPASLEYSSIEKFKANDGKEVVNYHQKDANSQHFWGQVDNC